MTFTPTDLNVRTSRRSCVPPTRCSMTSRQWLPSSTANCGWPSKLDAQLLYGDGVNPNVLGFTKLGVAWTPEVADTLIDKLVRIAATLLARGASGPVIGVNAQTVADIILSKDSNGDYVVNPFPLITQILGARLVPSAAIAEGDFVGIGGALGGTVGVRQGITVEISTEDADNF